ncbi:class A beta-lactamase-related serine hydrolase [Cryobacterium sp. TMT2-10]|uniref:Class A beta-lactamase-related serine hydrolase n=1 Tax=Cryobacterium shii TaxID=1259235 RepID=A0AAQ2HFT4_9MICO|nr:class A beta-lactamase-related serine hydrolase [Cryobacterium shii]TFD14111.1 class A beta-lactamase-related serine hydrolase [Cryobacterium sp. TMT4-10]TFD43331.1 class A beta-lactamase-related serine hydrolase [Cryobacterium sp. TMT2-10]
MRHSGGRHGGNAVEIFMGDRIGARRGRLRRRRSIRPVALVVAAVVVSGVLSGCSPDAGGGGHRKGGAFTVDVTERLDAAVADAIGRSGASGAVVGVWADGTGEWEAAPGTTTIGGTEAMSTEMRFRIGTNTTAMTCTVLLRLVEEGTVALDDPVATYLGRLVGVGDITLGQLCQNTSSLAGQDTEQTAQFVNNPTRSWPALELVSNGLSAPRTGAPGGTWVQSSTGIVLLGMALEQATGKDWRALYRQYIFNPLNLDDTSFPAADDLQIPGAHPQGYATQRSTDGQPNCEIMLDDTELSISMTGVAGGVVSTLADMRTWADVLAVGSVLGPASVEVQWSTVAQDANAPAWRRYGLGAEQLGPLRGRAGAIPGFISATLSDPAGGLTVVVALNNSTAGGNFALALARQLAAIATPATAAGTDREPLTLPWSEDAARADLEAGTVCPVPAAAAG